jgi:hypothetical protein
MGNNPKLLLVEDMDTKGAIIGLMGHHIKWGDNEDEWPVFIDSLGSSSKVLNKSILNVRLKQSDLNTLGLIVDADSDFDSRWNTVRDICSSLGGAPPETFPERGLILNIIGSVRFGVWIMPNNKSSGMVETFCHNLVPDHAKPSWSFARECVEEARKKGAPYKDAHLDKSHIHTWLAWQDPPGERIGIAFTKGFLDPKATIATQFVHWFRELFQC